MSFLIFFLIFLSILSAPSAGDQQLRTLQNCHKLFQPENKEIIEDLKNVVGDAVKLLPENMKEDGSPVGLFLPKFNPEEKIKNAEEFLKMIKFYNVAKENVGKPIIPTGRKNYDIHREQKRQNESKHIHAYKDFMNALAPSKSVFEHLKTLLHASASPEVELTRIMEARKICDDLAKQNSTTFGQSQMELYNLCHKLGEQIGLFLKAVGFNFEEQVLACKHIPFKRHPGPESIFIVPDDQNASIGKNGQDATKDTILQHDQDTTIVEHGQNVKKDHDANIKRNGKDATIMNDGQDVTIVKKGNDANIVEQSKDASIVKNVQNVSIVNEGKDATIVKVDHEANIVENGQNVRKSQNASIVEAGRDGNILLNGWLGLTGELKRSLSTISEESFSSRHSEEPFSPRHSEVPPTPWQIGRERLLKEERKRRRKTELGRRRMAEENQRKMAEKSQPVAEQTKNFTLKRSTKKRWDQQSLVSIGV